MSILTAGGQRRTDLRQVIYQRQTSIVRANQRSQCACQDTVNQNETKRPSPANQTPIVP